MELFYKMAVELDKLGDHRAHNLAMKAAGFACGSHANFVKKRNGTTAETKKED